MSEYSIESNPETPRDVPAFPTSGPDNGVYGAGISMRDYFAAKAMPAVLAAYIEANGRCLGTDHVANNCAAHAYRIADAMLHARDQEPS